MVVMAVSQAQSFIITLIIFVLALLWFIGAHSEPPPACLDESVSREKVRALMLEAIDEALKDHTKHMFEVWLKDPNHQPERAITGMRQGLTAYAGSRVAALRFDPPPCPSKEKAK